MKPEWNDSMAEATRLVNVGDLMEATAMIQRSLGNTNATGAAFGTSRPGTHGVRPAGASPEIDSPLQDFLEGVFERVATGHTDEAPARQAPQPADNPQKPADGWSGGRFIALSHRSAAGTRAYKLYVPAGDSTIERPLVVMLHGCTQGPDDFARGTRMNALADRHGFLVAYPEQPQSANPSRCWNWFNAADQHRDRGEPSLIAGIVGDIRSRNAIDTDRIHVVGFSAGAAMATVMAAEYPELFASAAIHSGLALGVAHDIPSALAVMRTGPGSGRRTTGGPLAGGILAGGMMAGGLSGSPLARNTLAGHQVASGPHSSGDRPLQIPIIVFHGDRDTTVHPRNGEHIVEQWSYPAGEQTASRSAGEPIVESGHAEGGRPFTRRVLRGDRTRPLLEHWRVHGGGHTWFGGSPSGTYTDPKGPDASAEIVRFFTQNPRRQSG